MAKRHINPKTLEDGACDAKSPASCPFVKGMPPEDQEMYHYDADDSWGRVKAEEKIAEKQQLSSVGKGIRKANDGDDYEVGFSTFATRPCMVCGQRSELKLDNAALFAYNQGALIQQAFPDLSADERELIKTGTHPECWEKALGSVRQGLSRGRRG